MPSKKRAARNTPLIVGTISTLAGLKRLLRARRIPCHIVEIRFDLIGTRHLPEVLRLITKLKKRKRPRLPILGTFRSHREGGRARLAESKRVAYIESFYPLVDLIDIEASSQSTLQKLLKRAEIPIVISYHNFRITPSLPVLKRFVRSVVRRPETIAKIACNLRNPKDLECLRKLLRSSPSGRVAAVGMGRMGPLSRFWLPYQGSVLTYGFLDRSAASGQVSAEELAKFFRLKS